MNYEEKYKEAIKRAKAMIKVAEKEEEVYKSAITIFPELEESEDEKTRKAILELVKQSSAILSPMNQDSMIAWLEKQQDIIDLKEYAKGILKGAAIHLMIWIDENLADGKMCLSNMECKDLEDAMVNAKWDKIYKYIKKKVEKQDEQKPIDKVEPKFKVGDWITNGEHTWKVTDIKPLDYILQSQNGDTVDDTISYVDEEFHLWTIQDAKDGDVLSQDSIPFIFKSWDNNCIAYCGITGFGLFKVVEDYFSWCNGINVTPATKEQRDLLFQKMKEEGYVWYAEKKELMKIEQNSAWSESEEDENFYNWCLAGIQTRYNDGFLTKSEYKQTKLWLQSLKDRVQPQPKQGWSEEDEKRVNSIISSIEYCLEQYPDRKEYAKDIDWLKSLKPQNRWKPSGKQMSVLQIAIKDYGICAEKNVLESLYNDLKNL